MLEIVSADRNDYNEVIARIATCCERATQALINVNTWAERMGVEFPDRLVGEDSTTDPWRMESGKWTDTPGREYLQGTSPDNWYPFTKKQTNSSCLWSRMNSRNSTT